MVGEQHNEQVTQKQGGRDVDVDVDELTVLLRFHQLLFGLRHPFQAVFRQSSTENFSSTLLQCVTWRSAYGPYLRWEAARGSSRPFSTSRPPACLSMGPQPTNRHLPAPRQTRTLHPPRESGSTSGWIKGTTLTLKRRVPTTPCAVNNSSLLLCYLFVTLFFHHLCLFCPCWG